MNGKITRTSVIAVMEANDRDDDEHTSKENG
eukprot:CAMPEP_0182438660 /NCGR_PEP_ID=MMETSP1167-20130531/85928_1 /TAXON_ID=2988 /ORGANISM="Mallomonas Sp, Strain CCMP3275" /LENGTH=30 /DNA_ID= /DNA_START= /DNA_END= /DNA_ORIENTATION=